MPLLEATYTKEEMDAQARQAHVIRTRARIQSWQARLPEASEAEKALILTELKTLERQLERPVSKRMLASMPSAPPQPAGVFATMFARLQEEINELKAKLGGHSSQEQPTAAVPDEQSSPDNG